MNFLKQAAKGVHTIGGASAVQSNQSFRAIPSPSHGSHDATALLDSRPPLLAPMASTQSTIANASSSLSSVPPLHHPFVEQQPQSAPLLHPFPVLTVSLIPPHRPYGMPSLQPFSPPNPLPLFTPSASYNQVLTRGQVGAALLRLAQVILTSLYSARCRSFFF